MIDSIRTRRVRKLRLAGEYALIITQRGCSICLSSCCGSVHLPSIDDTRRRWFGVAAFKGRTREVYFECYSLMFKLCVY